LDADSMRGLFPFFVAALTALPSPGQAFVVPPTTDPMFGDVSIFAPADAPRGVIALLSDDSGFGTTETALAESFKARGDLVIGLSWPSWRRHIAARRKENCDDLLGHVESLVATVERARAIAPYITPVLAGLGLGGSAARALAPEVANHRIAGVVAIHSSATLATESPLCGAIAHRRGSSWVYEAPGRSNAKSLREMEEQDVVAAGAAADAFAAAAGPHGPGDLADLPLFVTMPERPPTRLAVVLSGDGGMGPLDWDLANALAGRGIAVATIDSRRYFWTEREPEAVAGDLQRILHHFRHESSIERVALVGYSFGADALSLVYRRLSPRAKRDVAVVSLLSVAPATDLRIELRDEDYANARPLLDEAARIDAPTVQCVYGENDPAASLACPALALARPDIQVTRTSGGHGFDGDVERLADIIVAPLLAQPSGAARAAPDPVRTAPPSPRPGGAMP
jgi:type IV secretory pathway VirJ component